MYDNGSNAYKCEKSEGSFVVDGLSLYIFKKLVIGYEDIETCKKNDNHQG